MERPTNTRQDVAEDDFERRARAPQAGFVRELWLFLRDNKKWWLAPMIIVLTLFAALVLLGGTSVAPFIYTLF